MSAEDLATQFVSHYYTTVDSGNWQGLASLYQPQSILTFEGTKIEGGAQNIIQKWSSIGRLVHNIGAFRKDIQQTPGGSMILLVTGQLVVDSNPPLNFTQVFHLVPFGAGQFYIHNEMFRLSLA